MIFVTVGTIQYKFHRLAKVINQLSKETKHKIIIQSGHTQSFQTTSTIYQYSFLPLGKMQQYISEANLVIMHGGEGTLLDILEFSQYKPVIFPRESKYHEHVDNYQTEVAQYAQNRKWAYYGKTVEEILLLAHKQLKNNEKLELNKSVIKYNTNLVAYLSKIINNNNS